MPYYYLYSPTTGYSTSCLSSQTYCSSPCGPCCQTHPVVGGVGFARPVDIGFYYGPQQLDFIATYTVKSIKTRRRYGIACVGSPGSPWDDALEIELFDQMQGLGRSIGKVIFAHVASMIGNGTYNTTQIDGIRGMVSDVAWQAPNSCSCSCYDGVHTHFDAYNSTYINGALDNCSSFPWAYYGSTWLYEFYLP